MDALSLFRKTLPDMEDSMKQVQISESTRARILLAQRNEITEHHIYKKLSLAVKDKSNGDVLARIASDEKSHYEFVKD